MPARYFPDERPDLESQYTDPEQQSIAVFYNAGDEKRPEWHRASFDLEVYRRTEGRARAVRTEDGVSLQRDWVSSLKRRGRTDAVVYFSALTKKWERLHVLLSSLKDVGWAGAYCILRWTGRQQSLKCKWHHCPFPAAPQYAQTNLKWIFSNSQHGTLYSWFVDREEVVLAISLLRLYSGQDSIQRSCNGRFDKA